MSLNNMKAELKRFGITQGEVADFLGMSANNFSLKINEKIPMTVDEARKINTHFLPTVKLDYLLVSDGDIPTEAEQAKSRVEALVENIASDGTPMDREKVEIIGDLMESAERCDPAHVNHVLSI